MSTVYAAEEAAFDQGKECFENGASEEACPFQREDDSKQSLREAWLTGYSAAWCNARPVPDRSKPHLSTVVWHTERSDLPDKDERVIVEVWTDDFKGTWTTSGEADQNGDWTICNTVTPGRMVLGWCRFPRMAKGVLKG